MSCPKLSIPRVKPIDEDVPQKQQKMLSEEEIRERSLLLGRMTLEDEAEEAIFEDSDEDEDVLPPYVFKPPARPFEGFDFASRTISY